MRMRLPYRRPTVLPTACRRERHTATAVTVTPTAAEETAPAARMRAGLRSSRRANASNASTAPATRLA
jgi:hypothetical protein